MFFIFGMPRSGTTLIAQCLSAHTEIVVPYEAVPPFRALSWAARLRNKFRGKYLFAPSQHQELTTRQ